MKRIAEVKASAVAAFHRFNSVKLQRASVSIAGAVMLWFCEDLMHSVTLDDPMMPGFFGTVVGIMGPLGKILAVMMLGFGYWTWKTLPTSTDFRRQIEKRQAMVRKGELAGLCYAVKPHQLGELETLIKAVQEAHGSLRAGHLIWMLDVIEHRASATPIPDFAPGQEAAYDLECDIGFDPIIEFMRKRTTGQELDRRLFDELMHCANKGSPMSMHIIGHALIHGEFPGIVKNVAEGIAWLERCVSLPNPPPQTLLAYAEILRSHPNVQHDNDRAFELSRRGNVLLALSEPALS